MTTSILFRYAAVVAGVGLATFVRWLLDPAVGNDFPFITYFIAVLVAARFGGLGPSLATVFLGAFVGAVFFLPPRGRLAVSEAQDQVRIFLFVLLTTTCAVFSESLRSARHRAEASAKEAARNREALGVSEARYRQIVETAHEGVWVIDADGRTTFANDRMAEILACTVGDMLGRSAFDFVFPEDHPEGRRLVQQRELGVRETLLFRYRRADGTAVWLQVSASPIFDDAGGYAGSLGLFTDVTERRRSQESLRLSEERLRLALEAGRMGVWDWNIASNEIKWSDNLESVHGLTPGTFDGTIAAFLNLIHPEDRAVVDEAVRRSVESASGYDIEFRNVWPDGSVHWMAGKGQAFHENGKPARMVGVGMDITDRKRAEQDARFLADASATLAALVDYESTLQKVARLAVPTFADWCAVDMIDDEDTLRRLAAAHVDPAKVDLAHELHQRFPGDPGASRGIWTVIRTGRSEIVPEISDDMLTAAVADADLLRILRVLGLKSYMGVPLSVRGRVLGVLTFISAESGRRYDAGDLAMAEDLAHRAAVAIENARLYHEVREADRKKDEFLALLAHELRNPLAPVRNALHILKLSRSDDEVFERARGMAERQVHALTRMVDDLLDVSRIMRGKIELRRERADLATVVTRAIETARPAIDAGGHQLTVALPGQPVWIDADVVRLAQVVANLLNNAAKYTEAGGRIWLTATEEGGEAVVRVRDTGIGIAPETLRSVFDMFMQVDATGTRSQGGLGIGLTVVRNLVGMHGGAVEAHSTGVGRGSEFVVRLPLAEAVRAGRFEAVAPGPVGAATSAPRSILVVDDNADAGESLAILLRLQGHDVRVAHDGPSGLRVAEADPPEVAFLDIGMPGMSGHDVARQFRKSQALRGVLLVAMTGWGQDGDRRRSREAGFDHHLVKPVDPAALETVLIVPEPRG